LNYLDCADVLWSCIHAILRFVIAQKKAGCNIVAAQNM
jgi:hypothetical protein